MSDVWHIRGVSEESRKAAKMAAVAAGVPLGKWVEFAIAQVRRTVFNDMAEGVVKPVHRKISESRPKQPKYTTCNHGATYGTVCQFCPDNVAQEAQNGER